MGDNRFVCWSAVAIRVLLGLVFCASGWAHLQNEMFFYADVQSYGILPQYVVPFFVVALPTLHFILGTALIADVYVLGASCIASILLASFAIAQGWVVLLGKSIDCGCFGVLHQDTVGSWTITRTLFVLLLSLGLAHRFYQDQAKKETAQCGELRNDGVLTT